MTQRVRIAILTMGFSGLVAEILLLRELLIVFSGNELCIGIILSNWLILEALGSWWAGRRADTTRNPLVVYTAITLLFSLSTPGAIYLARILKVLIGVSIGESIGFMPMVYTSFLILLPTSVLHGAQFTYGCRLYAEIAGRDAAVAGRVYMIETVGTIIGGVVSTYFLIPYLNSFQAALWLALLNIIVCMTLFIQPRSRTGYKKTAAVCLGILALHCAGAIVGGLPERMHVAAVDAQWPNQNVVHYQNSRYGNVAVIETQGQYSYFLDGVPSIIVPVPDIYFVEEFVHLPLLAHPKPEKLLFISGGAGGMINEALKHPTVTAITYAELDPLLLELFAKYPTPLTVTELNDRRVSVTHTDGRRLLKTTDSTYDVILLGILDPSNLQTNRFFTQEFFRLAKDRLNPGGILVIGLPGSLTYHTDAMKDLNSCIYRTLKPLFSHIRVIPGDGSHMLFSSDAPAVSTVDPARLVRRTMRRGIQAQAVLPWHLENKLHPGWQQWYADFLKGGSEKTNRDFRPVGMFYSLSHWNERYAPSFSGFFGRLERIDLPVIAGGVGLALLLVFVFGGKRASTGRSGIALAIFTTGFAGMLFDLMIIFAFQSIYGYVFSWIGILVAAFMAGAAFGALLATRADLRPGGCLKAFFGIDAAIACFSIGCPLILIAAHGAMTGPGIDLFARPLFLFISFICGTLTGAQYPLANRIYPKSEAGVTRTAGLLYAFDLLGGWLGGIVGAVVLLPILGIAGAGAAIGMVKVTGLIILIVQVQRIRRGGNYDGLLS